MNFLGLRNIYLFLGWIWGCCAYAQPQYHVSLIDTETGMAQSAVYAMAKDSKGFMWFGTAQSLSRFDGSEVKNYDSKSTIPQSRMIKAIVEDINTDLWLGLGGCLVRFDRKKEQFIPTKTQSPTGLDFVRGWPMAIVGTKIWCVSPSSQEVFCYDYKTRIKTVFLTKIPFLIDNDNLLNGSFYDQKSSLWLHLTEGVLKFNIVTHKTTYFFSKHPRNKLGEPTAFFSIISIKDSVILANNARAFAMHIESSKYNIIKPLHAFKGRNNTIISQPKDHFDFQRDYGDGMVWIRRSFGVFKLSPLLPKFEKVTQATREALDQETSVRSVFSLNDSIVRIGMSIGNYWYNRRSKKFQQVAKKHPLVSETGRLLLTKEGYWIASAKKGLSLYEPHKNKMSLFLNPDTLTPDNRLANLLFKVLEISPNALLIASQSGLFVFNKKTRQYQRIPYFGTKLGRYPLQDRTGRLYISNEKLHVGRLRDTVWIPEKTLPVSHRFRNGFEDTLHHVVWGASTDGLKMINPKDWSLRVWDKKDGMKDSYIYDVLVDKQGMVWFSTNRGLSRLNLTTKHIDNFKLSDGLQSLEYNSNTAHIAPDGEFFFGGVRGFNHFYPDEVQFNRQLSKPILTNFTVKETPIKLPIAIGEASYVKLAAQNNSFAIEYSAIDYLSNGQNTYQYRLVGLDSAWVQAQQQTTARFVQVPAGKYVFEVKAANSDGLWNNKPTRLTIEIEPQWWETIWFRAAMLGLLLLGIYGFYRYRLYVLLQQQRKEMTVMVQTQEEERRRFSQDLHDGLGANLSALKMVLGLLHDPASESIKNKSEALLNASIDDLRQLIHAMSPRSLARLGLVKTVRELAMIINEAKQLNVTVTATDFPENLPDTLQVNLFRIVQELLQNTLKHAQATEVIISFSTLTPPSRAGGLFFHYTDNGRGFDPQAATAKGHGLQNLYTRAQLLNATLNIQSAVGKSTEITLEVPL